MRSTISSSAVGRRGGWNQPSPHASAHCFSRYQYATVKPDFANGRASAFATFDTHASAEAGGNILPTPPRCTPHSSYQPLEPVVGSSRGTSQAVLRHRTERRADGDRLRKVKFAGKARSADCGPAQSVACLVTPTWQSLLRCCRGAAWPVTGGPPQNGTPQQANGSIWGHGNYGGFSQYRTCSHSPLQSALRADSCSHVQLSLFLTREGTARHSKGTPCRLEGLQSHIGSLLRMGGRRPRALRDPLHRLGWRTLLVRLCSAATWAQR